MPQPSQQLVAHLPALQPDSGQRLPISILNGFASASGGVDQLIRIVHRGGEYVGVPAYGTASLDQHLYRRVKVFTLDQSQAGFTRMLATALKGGTSYPILEAVMSTAVGAVSGGAGLLFGVATLGVNLGRRSTDVLPRLGDELWHVEEIGQATESSMFGADSRIAMHVSSFFLVDPFRSASPCDTKGWLLHETRRRVVLD
ncbi:MAG TPA: hypothetical protein VFL93_13250 [Longimicrobiaceae bacterium]|nr:hypothetical protein [Longimicrobiaceae bacterium]